MNNKNQSNRINSGSENNDQIVRWEDDGGVVLENDKINNAEGVSIALQDKYGPKNKCFGCGPSNTSGLKIKSFPKGNKVVATWVPEARYEAFPNVLCGGIIGTLLDCHSNWAATWHLMKKLGLSQAPYTVTAEYSVKLINPTPTTKPVNLIASIVSSTDNKVKVLSEMLSDSQKTATLEGIFVSVRPGHPAYGRW